MTRFGRTVPLLGLSLLSAAVLSACGGGGDDDDSTSPPPVTTPVSVSLEKVGSYESGVFLKSAAEIPAFDAASKRGFVVNAQKGALDVLDMSQPAAPRLIGQIDATAVRAGASVNSVAVQGGLVAVAVQDAVKTNPGLVAIYRAADLSLVGQVAVGALPDMLTFTPDGKTLLVANEGEPSDDYQIDPEGSISVIDVSDPAKPVARVADFSAFNGQNASLLAQGVRIFGPGASVAQDLEPEYIAVAPDGKTAWASLQENNALAEIDIVTARVKRIVPLGYKDHGLAENALDFADNDGENPAIHITTAPGLYGMYQPDAIAAYQAGDGNTYIVSANEGDARAWGEGTPAYFGDGAGGVGDPSKGFVEEWRIKHLVHKDGFLRRADDDLPAHLAGLAKGALLNPSVFAWCGAVAGNPGDCRADDQLGRLKVTWTLGYQTHADGSPRLFNQDGVADPAGDRLMYDRLYTYGGRSISIWDANGQQVWDSGSAIESFLASADCKLGAARNVPCADHFNTGHDETAQLDARSSAKGPEPEGLTVGRLGDKTLAFIGLERMGGVLVYDITNPRAPMRMDYLNTRENWTQAFSEDEAPDAAALSRLGDLGPEGLHFIAPKDSPTGEPLLMVGNEVSGTTAVYRLKLTY
ncbi:alkaline phosphatase [Comamonas serinivorans]|uniref:Alkaline phosphatase n=1 Tax=Comamonas serinivorans TaxID=1082851 RepID=A0A1Y0ET42_9BURK|nr:choice-of-anchor I family protein [Comamonas serinivorans]ARU06570.1 alkaline phosphatase [Comamonas serinivorans]